MVLQHHFSCVRNRKRSSNFNIWARALARTTPHHLRKRGELSRELYSIFSKMNTMLLSIRGEEIHQECDGTITLAERARTHIFVIFVFFFLFGSMIYDNWRRVLQYFGISAPIESGWAYIDGCWKQYIDVSKFKLKVVVGATVLCVYFCTTSLTTSTSIDGCAENLWNWEKKKKERKSEHIDTHSKSGVEVSNPKQKSNFN